MADDGREPVARSRRSSPWWPGSPHDGCQVQQVAQPTPGGQRPGGVDNRGRQGQGGDRVGNAPCRRDTTAVAVNMTASGMFATSSKTYPRSVSSAASAGSNDARAGRVRVICGPDRRWSTRSRQGRPEAVAQRRHRLLHPPPRGGLPWPGGARRWTRAATAGCRTGIGPPTVTCPADPAPHLHRFGFKSPTRSSRWPCSASAATAPPYSTENDPRKTQKSHNSCPFTGQRPGNGNAAHWRAAIESA